MSLRLGEVGPPPDLHRGGQVLSGGASPLALGPTVHLCLCCAPPCPALTVGLSGAGRLPAETCSVLPGVGPRRLHEPAGVPRGGGGRRGKEVSCLW